MFWGLVVQPNKKYSKTVSTPFHVSQAVLDITNTPGDSDVQLILKSDKVDYILCILNKAERVQMPLNLIFSEGDEISFRSIGGTVHLTGYLVDEQNLPEYEEDESSDEDVPTLVDASKHKGKRQVRQESSGSENEDSAESGDEVGSDDEEDVEDEMEADSDNESDEEIEAPPAKVPKTNGMPNGVSKKEDRNKDKKKDAKQKKQQQRQTVDVAEKDVPESKASSHTDLKIEEIREGKGAEVKIGRKVQVYYEGRFKSNNKIFDKATSGKGFEFTVGRGSVIRGWDVGVLGMRAGGKRRLICPPSMAYGKKGSPPAIPPNATLVFDIEIKNVH
ncbi:hypothetical protein HA402_003547 [Bradysia odoriphaga]|nr:hypothetical protein HA402_003547 [Bradysia odoriphaga]